MMLKSVNRSNMGLITPLEPGKAVKALIVVVVVVVVGLVFSSSSLLASVANGSWATVVLLVANSSFATADDARVGNRWDSFSKDVRPFSFGLSVDGVQGFAFHGSFGSSLHASNGTGNVGQPQHAALFKTLPPRPRRFSHEIVEEVASTLGRGRVGTIARQPAADHATCLKCNVTMVSPLPNCVKAAVVSATCVSIMSNTSLRTSIYLMCNGSKY